LNQRLQTAALIGAVAAAVLLAWQAGSVWRTMYPHLPARAQGLPYQLRAKLDRSEATPVPVPTAGATSAVGLSAAPVALTPTPARGASHLDLAHLDLPPEVTLRGLRHEYQTWNNCGPATISMALGYFGASEGQAQAARHLKPDPDDKNVSPDELARYARDRGFEALVRVNGNHETMRALLALGVPVIVETWFVPEPGDEMGHYRVLIGYSDADRRFVTDDSYNGPGVSLDYDIFDELWRVFNRSYLVVHPPELAGSVQAAIGRDGNDGVMYTGAAALAWFNLGSSLLGLGDTAGAAGAFDQARAIGLPWRMLWYQPGPFEAYAAEGRWDDVVALSDANLRNAPNLEESHYWLGRSLMAHGDEEGARAAWRRALDLNPLFTPAEEALADAD
jgi:tetratricopeptide (TPR) repeat protein